VNFFFIAQPGPEIPKVTPVWSEKTMDATDQMSGTNSQLMNWQGEQ
jgi:hypothetical protein